MKLKLFLLSIIFISILFTLYQVFLEENEVAISQKEAEAIALNLYNGEIIKSEIVKKKKNYNISVANDKGIYRLTIDGQTKKVSNVKQIKKKELLLTLDEAKGKIQKELKGKVTDIKKSTDKKLHAEALVEKKQENIRVLYDLKKHQIVSTVKLKKNTQSTPTKDKHKNTISQQQIKKVALSQLNGDVDVTNITKLDSKKGVVYKVTIQNKSEGAHVYVLEATKEVSSISWFSKKQKTAEDSDEDDDDDISEPEDDDDDDDDHDVDSDD